MPHIVIKAMEGQPREKMQETAERIRAVVAETLGAPPFVVSVSLEECPREGWPGVFNEYVKDKENVLVKPGYADPVTFEPLSR